MKFGFFAKVLTVSIIAAISAGILPSVLLTWDMDAELKMAAISRMMLTSFLGSSCIGLPLALGLFRVVRSDEQFGFWHLLLVGNGAGVVIASIAAMSSGLFGLVFLGVPILLACNAFAIAGWFMILRPFRRSSDA